MDLTRVNDAPSNPAIVPDIYNKLDVKAIASIRVANTILDLRLGVEKKIIAKYRQAADRQAQNQQAEALADLSRILQRLPSRFKQAPDVSPRSKFGQKSYMAGVNEELVCHRCYIHHLPTKKRFYKTEHHATDIFSSEDAPVSPHGEFSDDRKEQSPTASEIPLAKVIAAKVIAPIDKYRFLEKDLCGRDKDLNTDTLTPRLMPYEAWKSVVKNICSQCKREVPSSCRSTASRVHKLPRSSLQLESIDIHLESRASRRSGRISIDSVAHSKTNKGSASPSRRSGRLGISRRSTRSTGRQDAGYKSPIKDRSPRDKNLQA